MRSHGTSSYSIEQNAVITASMNSKIQDFQERRWTQENKHSQVTTFNIYER